MPWKSQLFSSEKYRKENKIMIISASRRTDIPAFYAPWFMNRIHAGFVDTINPFNRKQVSRISLRPEDVECIVFWTKNAAPMMPYLTELDKKYKFYFQFTITPYGHDIEPALPPKNQIIQTFRELSKKLGKERVVWRYDPILLNDYYTIQEHMQDFSVMLEKLAPYTDRCVISFLDLYRKTERNTRPLHLHPLGIQAMNDLAKGLSQIAKGSGVILQTCSEAIDLDAYGIAHGACIDKERIEKVIGVPIDVKKDDTQRDVCHCMKSVDIGQYDTCLHLCRYCYANTNSKTVEASYANHHPNSTILSGELRGDEKITERKVMHLRKKISLDDQMYSLF